MRYVSNVEQRQSKGKSKSNGKTVFMHIQPAFCIVCIFGYSGTQLFELNTSFFVSFFFFFIFHLYLSHSAAFHLFQFKVKRKVAAFVCVVRFSYVDIYLLHKFCYIEAFCVRQWITVSPRKLVFIQFHGNIHSICIGIFSFYCTLLILIFERNECIKVYVSLEPRFFRSSFLHFVDVILVFSLLFVCSVWIFSGSAVNSKSFFFFSPLFRRTNFECFSCNKICCVYASPFSIAVFCSIFFPIFFCNSNEFYWTLNSSDRLW